MRSAILLAVLAQWPGHAGDMRSDPIRAEADFTVGDDLSVTDDIDAESIEVDGTCATFPSGAAKACYDSGGVRMGMPLTDAAAATAVVRGYTASPIGSSAANRTGGSIKLCGGVGTRRGAMTQANATAGVDTITLTVDGGTPVVITAHATTTSATLFAVGTTDAEIATNVAAAFNLNTATTGVTACAGAGCTLFTGVAGTYYLYPSGTLCEVTHVTSDATMDSITNGSDGQVQFGWGAQALPSITWVGDTDTGWLRLAANNVNAAGAVQLRGLTTGTFGSIGSTGSAFMTVSDTAPAVSLVGSADMAVGSTSGRLISHTEMINFCGNGPNGATTVYLSPGGDGTIYSGATCDALDGTTEATQDLVWRPFDFTAVAMECGCTDVAVDTGLTFALRDDTADASADLTCTTGAGDGAGFVSCVDADTTPPTIAAGSAIAMRIVAASGNFSTADCFCRVTVSQ